MRNYQFVSLVSFLIILCSCQQESLHEEDVDVIDCTNGVQDNNELGIDCGGHCPDCLEIIETRNIFEAKFLDEYYELSADENQYHGTNTHQLLSLCTAEFNNTIRRYLDSGGLDQHAAGIQFSFSHIDLQNFYCNLSEGFPYYFELENIPWTVAEVSNFGINVQWTDLNGKIWYSENALQNDESYFRIYKITKTNRFSEKSPIVMKGSLKVMVQDSDGEGESLLGDFNLFISI